MAISLSNGQREELYSFLALSMHLPFGWRMSLTLPHLDLFVGGFRWNPDTGWEAPVFVASTGELAGSVRATAGDHQDDPPFFFLPDWRDGGALTTVLRDKNRRWRLWHAALSFAEIVAGGDR